MVPVFLNCMSKKRKTLQPLYTDEPPQCTEINMEIGHIIANGQITPIINS